MSVIPQNSDLAAEVVELKNRIEELEALVKYYEERFRLNQHRQFGASSEKTNKEQITIFDEQPLFNEAETNSDERAGEPELTEVQKHYRKHNKHKRTTGENLPEGFPVEKVEHALGEEEQICPECGGLLHVMGHESRRELQIIPAQVKIIEHVSPVYACRNCEKTSDHTPIVKSAVPEPVIKGSFASPESVAHVMTQKYAMGLPLYRMEQEWNRQGIMLSRQTMANWVIRCAEDWLKTIYDRMYKRLLEHDVLHADETPVQVLHEPGKTAQSESYMWVYRTSGETKSPIVMYEYQPDRKGIRPKEFLKGFKGYLHTDGLERYHELPEGITIVGCLAHVKRKFSDALKGAKNPAKAEIIEARKNSAAAVGIWYCDALFRLERKYENYTFEKRYKARLKYSLPLAEDFLLWSESANVLPKSLTGEAVKYLQNQWIYLKNVYLDGRLELSNNRAERSVKSFVLGRKSWLFSNTVKGAKASSIVYSIIETAKENFLRPFEYLVHLFKTLPNTTTSKIDDLLPYSDKIPDFCRAPKKDT